MVLGDFAFSVEKAQYDLVLSPAASGQEENRPEIQ